MELITSLISSSAKASASETIMMTQRFIMKTTNGSLLGATLISTPNDQRKGSILIRQDEKQLSFIWWPVGQAQWICTAILCGCIITPILQIRKLRFKRGHLVNKWRSQDSRSPTPYMQKYTQASLCSGQLSTDLRTPRIYHGH